MTSDVFLPKFHSCAFPGFRYETSPEEKKYLQITQKLPFGAQLDFRESTNVKKFFNELNQKDVKPSKRISFGTRSNRPIMPAVLPTSRLGMAYPLNMAPQKPSKLGPGIYSIEKITCMATKVTRGRNRVWFYKIQELEDLKPPKSLSSRLVQSDINARQKASEKVADSKESKRSDILQIKSHQEADLKGNSHMFRSTVPRDLKLAGNWWQQSIPGVGTYMRAVDSEMRKSYSWGGNTVIKPSIERRCPVLKFIKKCSKCDSEPVGDYWEHKVTGEYLCRPCFKTFYRDYQPTLDFQRVGNTYKKVRDLPIRPIFGGCQPITSEKTVKRENLRRKKEWYFSAFDF